MQLVLHSEVRDPTTPLELGLISLLYAKNGWGAFVGCSTGNDGVLSKATRFAF